MGHSEFVASKHAVPTRDMAWIVAFRSAKRSLLSQSERRQSRRVNGYHPLEKTVFVLYVGGVKPRTRRWAANGLPLGLGCQ